MATMTNMNIMESAASITASPDIVIVDYDDNTQKIFESSTDRSKEATKVKSILDVFFGS